MNAGSSMMERAKKLAQQKKRRELKNCTFKPKLTRSRSAPKARVSGSFLERMNAFEAKKGQNISKACGHIRLIPLFFCAGAGGIEV